MERISVMVMMIVEGCDGEDDSGSIQYVAKKAIVFRTRFLKDFAQNKSTWACWTSKRVITGRETA